MIGCGGNISGRITVKPILSDAVSVNAYKLAKEIEKHVNGELKDDKQVLKITEMKERAADADSRNVKFMATVTTTKEDGARETSEPQGWDCTVTPNVDASTVRIHDCSADNLLDDTWAVFKNSFIAGDGVEVPFARLDAQKVTQSAE